MKSYFLSLLGVALLTAAVGILAPSAKAGRALKPLLSLVWLLALTAPLAHLSEGSFPTLPDLSPEGADEEYREILEGELDAAGRAYFCSMLETTLCEQFSWARDEVDCRVEWSEQDGRLSPTRVTLILSGRAIWSDPREHEAFVKDLLGCEVRTVIGE